ncbi:hypothetical protein [Vibrio phage VpKK5]|uniref:hypothetical protein n=1 Tax=Vibrio phage VpKK5 TaxID=1538804 RepID=UPI0004F849D0|nr:hypothetical protein VC55_gp16 [Vibrio phage VpKK5]AIM40600.1 hypothetical protein [Vibrio phage VpKK5]
MTLPSEQEHSLLTKTRELLLADPRSSYTIATELQLPYHWVRDVEKGRCKNPAVNRVQYLYEKLSGKKLEV